LFCLFPKQKGTARKFGGTAAMFEDVLDAPTMARAAELNFAPPAASCTRAVVLFAPRLIIV
jgi:hypothetical protein